MSALERSAPRFCFRPRSMAVWSESGMTPGISFCETLPAKGLTPVVPGMGWPGMLDQWTIRIARGLAARRKGRVQ